MPGAVVSPSESSTDGDPQQGRDLVGPPVILTGVVSIRGTCTVLDVQGRRWVLLGERAHTLVEGRQVTVRGRPARVPADCDADFAVTVRSVG